MRLEELKTKHQKLLEASNATLDNTIALANESKRVAEVACNSREILDNLNSRFEEQTGLNGIDISFLFFATAMQCARIFLINKLTQIEAAGQNNKAESAIHNFQSKILKKFGVKESLHPTKYNAPLNQIVLGRGVPYDATAYGTEEMRALEIFKGANHRFATLGHDPVLGLIFGTTNILTNTITCAKAPIISTFHVTYDSEIKNPKITAPASTITALKHAADRCKADIKSVVAAVIKQILHIGTDLYTPKGIQLPGENLVLSNTRVEELTKYISTGDVIKAGASANISILINSLITIVHSLMYDETKHGSRNLYNIKTRKIVMYSNTIATASNLVWVGANAAAGNEGALKNIDIGGLIVTINRLLSDTEFIQNVKEEFILGNFNALIQGDDLQLKEVISWD